MFPYSWWLFFFFSYFFSPISVAFLCLAASLCQQKARRNLQFNLDGRLHVLNQVFDLDSNFRGLAPLRVAFLGVYSFRKVYCNLRKYVNWKKKYSTVKILYSPVCITWPNLMNMAFAWYSYYHITYIYGYCLSMPECWQSVFVSDFQSLHELKPTLFSPSLSS